MSTDAQPRRRKEKRRKKETSSGDRARAEAEYVARKFSVADDSDEGSSPAPPKSQPPRASPAFGEGDSIIHVDHEGGTGGHWCAKIVFFALLAALTVLIGLIIAENRGLTDLDAPATESRFAQIFDGWVDEGPLHDDHHDEHTLELKHHDEDHDDEGDEEEDGHDEEIEDIESDVEDGQHDDGDEDVAHDREDEDDISNDVDDRDEVDSRENSAEVSREIDEENDDGDDNDDDEDDDDGNNDDNDDDDGDDNDDDGNDDGNDDNIDSIENEDEEEEQENLSIEINESHNKYDDENYNGAEEEDDDDDYINMYRDRTDDDNGSDEKRAANQESTEDILNFSNEDDIEETSKDIPFEEVDSFEEEVVDNTAGEEELLAAKKAEKLAQEQEESNNMGMRVAVGVALVLVTYCVLARKWRNANEDDDDAGESPTDRRMTLLPDDIQDSNVNNEENELEDEITQTTMSTNLKSQPRAYDEEKEDSEKIAKFSKLQLQTEDIAEKVIAAKQEENDDNENAEEEDDEEVEYEEEEEEPLVKSNDVILQDSSKTKEEPESEEEIVEEEEELVDDEELDEEIVEEEEEEEDEEEISEELDDSELMKKLEEKYGKLPDYEDEAEGNSEEEKPVVPARKRPKPTGGNSIEEDSWSVDSNDDWKIQLDLAQAEMDEGKLEDAFRHFTSLSLTNPLCWRAKLGRAKTMDLLAEAKRNNNILDSAISTYKEVLNMTISQKEFIAVAERTIDRIRFRGQHMDAVNIHNKLIKKFPSDPKYRNQLAITYLMVNKVDLARNVLKSTLSLWPKNGVALVHYGFILKTIDNNLEEGVLHMQKGIDTKESGTLEGRFLFHLGDALARLGRQNEASEIYQLGASIKVFLSSQQRSLYNVDRLTGRPWWKRDQTPYVKFLKSLENNWKAIAKEASEIQSHFKLEQENLKDTGHWSQYELFVRGVEIKSHCAKCPITCQIARSEPAAYGCRRGQIKFSAMTPGTHIYAHTGPTNCRLRVHLGLQGTKNTYIRVDKEIRSWEEGKIFIFDDSFEHEVWHNGSLPRIVLIVDLWHPELTKEEKLYLPAI